MWRHQDQENCRTGDVDLELLRQGSHWIDTLPELVMLVEEYSNFCSELRVEFHLLSELVDETLRPLLQKRVTRAVDVAVAIAQENVEIERLANVRHR